MVEKRRRKRNETREKGRKKRGKKRLGRRTSERFGAMLSESVFCSGKRVDLGGGVGVQ